jgi:hypothetical protein
MAMTLGGKKLSASSNKIMNKGISLEQLSGMPLLHRMHPKQYLTHR